MSLQRHLQALGVDIVSVLEQLAAPVALVDASGTLLWQNAAAIAFVGDLRGTRLAAIAPDCRLQSETSLARRSMGLDPVTNAALVLIAADGGRKRVETLSISLANGDGLAAILGIVKTISDGSTDVGRERLTPRLQETLRLLAAGSRPMRSPRPSA
jgi:hypothetical protein